MLAIFGHVTTVTDARPLGCEQANNLDISFSAVNDAGTVRWQKGATLP